MEEILSTLCTEKIYKKSSFLKLSIDNWLNDVLSIVDFIFKDIIIEKPKNFYTLFYLINEKWFLKEYNQLTKNNLTIDKNHNIPFGNANKYEYYFGILNGAKEIDKEHDVMFFLSRNYTFYLFVESIMKQNMIDILNHLFNILSDLDHLDDQVSKDIFDYDISREAIPASFGDNTIDENDYIIKQKVQLTKLIYILNPQKFSYVPLTDIKIFNINENDEFEYELYSLEKNISKLMNSSYSNVLDYKMLQLIFPIHYLNFKIKTVVLLPFLIIKNEEKYMKLLLLILNAYQKTNIIFKTQHFQCIMNENIKSSIDKELSLLNVKKYVNGFNGITDLIENNKLTQEEKNIINDFHLFHINKKEYNYDYVRKKEYIPHKLLLDMSNIFYQDPKIVSYFNLLEPSIKNEDNIKMNRFYDFKKKVIVLNKLKNDKYFSNIIQFISVKNDLYPFIKNGCEITSSYLNLLETFLIFIETYKTCETYIHDFNEKLKLLTINFKLIPWIQSFIFNKLFQYYFNEEDEKYKIIIQTTLFIFLSCSLTKEGLFYISPYISFKQQTWSTLTFPYINKNNDYVKIAELKNQKFISKLKIVYKDIDNIICLLFDEYNKNNNLDGSIPILIMSIYYRKCSLTQFIQYFKYIINKINITENSYQNLYNHFNNIDLNYYGNDFYLLEKWTREESKYYKNWFLINQDCFKIFENDIVIKTSYDDIKKFLVKTPSSRVVVDWNKAYDKNRIIFYNNKNKINDTNNEFTFYKFMNNIWSKLDANLCHYDLIDLIKFKLILLYNNNINHELININKDKFMKCFQKQKHLNIYKNVFLPLKTHIIQSKINTQKIGAPIDNDIIDLTENEDYIPKKKTKTLLFEVDDLYHLLRGLNLFKDLNSNIELKYSPILITYTKNIIEFLKNTNIPEFKNDIEIFESVLKLIEDKNNFNSNYIKESLKLLIKKSNNLLLKDYFNGYVIDDIKYLNDIELKIKNSRKDNKRNEKQKLLEELEKATKEEEELKKKEEEILRIKNEKMKRLEELDKEIIDISDDTQNEIINEKEINKTEREKKREEKLKEKKTPKLKLIEDDDDDIIKNSKETQMSNLVPINPDIEMKDNNTIIKENEETNIPIKKKEFQNIINEETKDLPFVIDDHYKDFTIITKINSPSLYEKMIKNIIKTLTKEKKILGENTQEKREYNTKLAIEYGICEFYYMGYLPYDLNLNVYTVSMLAIYVEYIKELNKTLEAIKLNPKLENIKKFIDIFTNTIYNISYIDIERLDTSIKIENLLNSFTKILKRLDIYIIKFHKLIRKDFNIQTELVFNEKMTLLIQEINKKSF